ncbi:hemerythrin domain-containing protein [Legionella sainthelensi]|uniref:hemerythrin domain-containing protein n=1 Tax=Legionella sainthelensi TaxID=28087 RepID=UPI000E1FE1C6|nr:hemerythrin domain-containing protein [Legionella sainthelensi]
MSIELSRRDFLKKAGLVLGGTLIAGPLLTKPIFGAIGKIGTAGTTEEEVSPDEDLMREHGVLRRIILIYREAIHRINDKQELNPTLITKSASIIRHFIEDYHEKLEENYLFPRFEKAGQLIDLVNTLKAQHQAGRKLTNHIMELASSGNFKNHGKDFIDVTSHFIRMYEPHAAREDTVLFPALRRIVSESEYKEMGEKFEDEEHKLFGQSGFEDIVSQVVDIEKELNIYDLSKFTPK